MKSLNRFLSLWIHSPHTLSVRHRRSHRPASTSITFNCNVTVTGLAWFKKIFEQQKNGKRTFNRSVTTMARTEHTFLSSNHHFQSNLSACFVAVGAAILSLTVRHTFWISIVHNQYQYRCSFIYFFCSLFLIVLLTFIYFCRFDVRARLPKWSVHWPALNLRARQVQHDAAM